MIISLLVMIVNGVCDIGKLDGYCVSVEMELLPSGLLYHCIGIMPFSVLPERDRYLMFGVFIETVYDYAAQ